MGFRKNFQAEAANEFMPHDEPYPKSRSHLGRGVSERKESLNGTVKKEEKKQSNEDSRDIRF